MLFGPPLILVASLLFGFAAWATFAPLAGGAIAPGQVIIDGHRHSIQHFEGGILSKLSVAEGTWVNEGDVLAEIDPTAASARRDASALRLLALRVKEARLQSEQLDSEEMTVHSAFHLANTVQSSEDIVQEEENVLRRNREVMNAQLQVLSEKDYQTRAQIRGLEAQQRSAREQIASIEEDIEGQRILLEKGLARVPAIRLLERQRAELDGNLRFASADEEKLRSALRELEASRMEIVAARELRIATELAETMSGIKQATEELKLLDDSLNRTQLVAPIAGRVMNVIEQSPGAVVKPGQEIMAIVPHSPKLIVEAHVSPVDVENLTIGDKALLVFPSFSQRQVPRMSGELMSVSGDVIFDDASGRPFYLARIAVPAHDTGLQRVLDKLKPGMPVDVTVVTKSRTLAEYLLSPLTESFRKSVVSD